MSKRVYEREMGRTRTTLLGVYTTMAASKYRVSKQILTNTTT